MEKIKTEFKDLYVFKSKRFKDNRGYFREMFIQSKLKSKIVFLPKRAGERYASALTSLNLKNKVHKYFGKINLSDYIKNIIEN